ncbi:alpha/beta hydrolase fold protein [Aureobasidium melanogenum CBS 110374]|uniref:Alpha/beta hydrolase fold protein n=1 Tax=Aureobasidium melanogenum (strain CBS 110374) TaxID=1043003 RepID=A0A074WD97_AURM1|nr:alpha/beta hydrolase fold protein [Aureobasidium melanogenum CBS 110374]KEQ60461.1 alpha/beta hydrolase fold protein [Aureobasidium melanogenum CBS 110374]
MSAKQIKDCIQTEAGAIEAKVLGSGTPILVIHGSPGGIDSAIAMSRFLLDQEGEFQTICLSRMDYLNTPLSKDDSSINAEADLIAALLDTLNISRAGVLAWSGGGPVAFQLAARHPTRVSCVMAIATVSSKYIPPKPCIIDRIMFGTRFGEHVIKYLASHAPDHIVAQALEQEGSLGRDELQTQIAHVLANSSQRQLILDTAVTVNIGNERKAGWKNDMADFAAIGRLDLEQIECSVLLVHGDADTDAPLHYSQDAHQRLRNSELVTIPRGTHLGFYAHPQACEMQARAKEWFQYHAKEAEEH